MAVVALLTDVTLRLRLTGALKGWSAPLDCVADVHDVRARLATGHVRALVVGPRDAAERPAAPLVADVRRDHPSVTVVAYCAAGPGSSEDILALVGAGAHALVVRGIDDERHAFRAALRGAEQRCTAALVYARVRDHLPAAVAPLVALYLRADGMPPSVAEAADLLGVHRKTLVNRLAAAGCPTPRALRTWCRLFVAARLLEEPGRTIDSIARQLDFDSTTGLRNALKRYTGHGAGAIRAAGGLAPVLAHFNAACAVRRPAIASPLTAASAPNAASTALAHPDVPRVDAAAPPRRPAPADAARARLRSVVTDLGTAATRALVVTGALWLQFGPTDDILCLAL
ncbi:MAG TPA: helix-turn-helix domain-containing protein [Gemmatirosa sp.]